MTWPAGQPIDGVPTARHAWVDASAGVAGDMLLGALLDAGADLDVVQRCIDLVLPDAVRLDRTEVTRAGQRATKVDVTVLTEDLPHRTWRTIRDLLVQSRLDPDTRHRALSVFEALARAEGHVHGIPAADVHFHEVGALDSIADVVGVCGALTDLRIATVSAGEVAVGSGRIAVAHGDIPVPVPAVAQLARGWKVLAGGRGELTTPTGMALVSTLSDTCEELPPILLDTIGVGAGSKDTAGRPNVTRVVIGQPTGRAPEAGAGAEAALVLEANIDDLDPRLWPGILDRLLQVGAADAWLVPILMKKGRPAHTLTVLCSPERAERLRSTMFEYSSTIGLREHPARKRALARAWYDVDVPGGTVSIKIAHRDNVIVQATPEFDTVTSIAARLGRPPQVILEQAVAAAVAADLIAGAAVPVRARPTQAAPSSDIVRNHRALE